jgi:hypothetical protein
MVFTFKFKVRKLKRKTKLLSGPLIRKFRKKSKEYEISTKLRSKKSRDISLYSYYNLLDSLNKNKFLVKKRLKQLKTSRNNYYGSISSTFTRTNLLSDILKNRKPSLLRNYTFSNDSGINHSLDFKFMFPKNSIEAETLGYFNNMNKNKTTTPIFGSEIGNSRMSNMSICKKLTIDNIGANKNYNKLKNNSKNMLIIKKDKFSINKIQEKKIKIIKKINKEKPTHRVFNNSESLLYFNSHKKSFIKNNNKTSNKQLIKIATKYSCRKISEKKQNILSNINRSGQT